MKKIDKIFGDKKATAVVYILLAVGLFMLAGGNSITRNDTRQLSQASAAQNDSLACGLERILSEIDGVGEVKVMLCMSEENLNKSDSVFSGSAEEKSERVSGVLIVADGGADARVREKIVRATKAALGVEPHKIEVLERIV